MSRKSLTKMMNPMILSTFQVATLSDSFYTAFSTFLTEIFAFIPNLIAAVVTLLVGYLIVRAVVKAVDFGMRRANLERHIGHTNLGHFVERSGQTFTNITVTTVKWVLLLVVAVYAISVLNIPPLTASMLGILAWIPDLVAAAIIVFAGAMIASFVGKGIENTLPRYGVTGGRLVGLAVELLIYAMVFNFALIQLGFGQGILFMATTAASWGLAAALAVGIGVPMAYSLKEVVPPMVTGATTIASTLKEGQEITVEGIANAGTGDHGAITGTVRNVGMFNTIIERTGNGNAGFLILPNNLLIDRPITVKGGEAPRPWEHGMRERASDLHDRFNESSGAATAESSGRASQTRADDREEMPISH